MALVLVVGMWGFRMWSIIDGDEGVRNVSRLRKSVFLSSRKGVFDELFSAQCADSRELCTDVQLTVRPGYAGTAAGRRRIRLSRVSANLRQPHFHFGSDSPINFHPFDLLAYQNTHACRIKPLSANSQPAFVPFTRCLVHWLTFRTSPSSEYNDTTSVLALLQRITSCL